jgi:hypothetical protein
MQSVKRERTGPYATYGHPCPLEYFLQQINPKSRHDNMRMRESSNSIQRQTQEMDVRGYGWEYYGGCSKLINQYRLKIY